MPASTPRAPDGATAGSKQKASRPSSRRRGAASSASIGTSQTSASSTTATTNEPVGATAGAAHDRSNVVSRRGRPPRRCSHSSPSTPTYTTPEPSASQSKHPPPIERPGRGSGDVVSIRSGPPATSTIVTAARVPQRCTNATGPAVRGESRLGELTAREDQFDGNGFDAAPAGADQARSTRRETTTRPPRRNSLARGEAATCTLQLSPRRRCPMIDPNQPNTTTRPTMSPVARTTAITVAAPCGGALTGA